MESVEAETLDRGLLRMEWLELKPPPSQCVLRTTSTFLHPCFVPSRVAASRIPFVPALHR